MTISDTFFAANRAQPMRHKRPCAEGAPTGNTWPSLTLPCVHFGWQTLKVFSHLLKKKLSSDVWKTTLNFYKSVWEQSKSKSVIEKFATPNEKGAISYKLMCSVFDLTSAQWTSVSIALFTHRCWTHYRASTLLLRSPSSATFTYSK